MTEKSDTTSVVRNLFEEPPETPKHKQLFDDFVEEAFHSSHIMDGLFLCNPDLELAPSYFYSEENLMCIRVGHDSELADEVDWLGGNFCKEMITFSVQHDGTLLRIIELAPSRNPSKADSRYINANLGTGKAREFTNYITGEPWKDLEGILPFLEINDEERQEIASLHRDFRHRYFLANAALARSESIGDISE